MKIIGKIMLFVAGILLLISGISAIVPTIKALIAGGLEGKVVALSVLNILAAVFSVFAGLAGISCLFIATPRRVHRVCGYATIILVLMIIDLVLQIILLISNGLGVAEVFQGIWAYLLGSVTGVVYMLGALFLRKSYKNL